MMKSTILVTGVIPVFAVSTPGQWRHDHADFPARAQKLQAGVTADPFHYFDCSRAHDEEQYDAGHGRLLIHSSSG